MRHAIVFVNQLIRLPENSIPFSKKLLKEEKIDKKFYDDSRVHHPRASQICGLPKINKPGTPLRPIVSFCDTPLSALHKQLANLLKPITMSTCTL